MKICLIQLLPHEIDFVLVDGWEFGSRIRRRNLLRQAVVVVLVKQQCFFTIVDKTSRGMTIFQVQSRSRARLGFDELYLYFLTRSIVLFLLFPASWLIDIMRTSKECGGWKMKLPIRPGLEISLGHPLRQIFLTISIGRISSNSSVYNIKPDESHELPRSELIYSGHISFRSPR